MTLLRDYHAAIGEIFIKYNGTLERYAGDGVMVVFNDPAAHGFATLWHNAARGRLIPFNSNSPTGSTFTAFSTFVSTRGLMRICPGFASSHCREATLDTVPIAA